jgi:hypothetical protein
MKRAIGCSKLLVLDMSAPPTRLRLGRLMPEKEITNP